MVVCCIEKGVLSSFNLFLFFFTKWSLSKERLGYYIKKTFQQHVNVSQLLDIYSVIQGVGAMVGGSQELHPIMHYVLISVV